LPTRNCPKEFNRMPQGISHKLRGKKVTNMGENGPVTGTKQFRARCVIPSGARSPWGLPPPIWGRQFFNATLTELKEGTTGFKFVVTRNSWEGNPWVNSGGPEFRNPSVPVWNKAHSFRREPLG